LDCLVVLTVSEIFEVRDFSLNSLSLLDRVSAHQAPTDTSTEPHPHQIIKNIETNTKNTKNNSIFRSKPSTQARLAKNSINSVKIQHLRAVSSNIATK